MIVKTLRQSGMIVLIVEYGMLSDEKFYERSENFALYPNVDGSFFTMKEFSEKIKETHKDKDGKTIYLYQVI